MALDIIIVLLTLLYVAMFHQNVGFYRNVDLYIFILVVVVIQVSIGSIIIDKVIVNSVQKRASEYGIFMTKISAILMLSAHMVVEIYLLRSLRLKKIVNTYEKKTNFKNTIYILFLVLCCAFILMLSFGGLPQKLLFSGQNAASLAFKRVTELHSSSSIAVLVKNAIAFNLCILTSLLIYVYHKESGKFFALALISFFISIYILTFDLSKSKVIWYLLSIYAIKVRYDYLKLGKKPFFKIFFFGIGIFALLALLFALTLPDLNFMKLVEYLFARIAISQISGAPHFFDIHFNIANVLFNHILETAQLGDFEAPGQFVMSKLFTDQYNSGLMNYISVPAGIEAIAIFGIIAGSLIYLIIYLFIRLIFTLKESVSENRRVIMTTLSGYAICNSNLSSSVLPFMFTLLPLAPIFLLIWFRKFKI